MKKFLAVLALVVLIFINYEALAGAAMLVNDDSDLSVLLGCVVIVVVIFFDILLRKPILKLWRKRETTV